MRAVLALCVSRAIHISDDDGPLHFEEAVEHPSADPGLERGQAAITGVSTAVAEENLISGADSTWSAILRKGIQEGIYPVNGTGCFDIPLGTALADLAQLSEKTSACPANPSADAPSFLQLRSNADLIARAYAMNNDERATLQNELEEKEDKWPDDLDSDDPDADKDDVPKEPRASRRAVADDAVDRAENMLSTLSSMDIDLRTYVYPILAKKLAELVFNGGCPRNYHERVCPLRWDLYINDAFHDEIAPGALMDAAGIRPEGIICRPRAEYRGLCSQIDFSNLLERQSARVREELARLSVFCWFEFPCVPSPEIIWSGCPMNYRLLEDAPSSDQLWCLRYRDIGGKCSPILKFTAAATNASKAAVAEACDEAWPVTDSPLRDLLRRDVVGEKADEEVGAKSERSAQMVAATDGAGPVDFRSGVVVTR